MFADDLALVAEMVAKYGPVEPLFVEAGGLEDPTIADYSKTIAAMVGIPHPEAAPSRMRAIQDAQIAAQFLRYQKIHRPFDRLLPGYACEDPGSGGCSIEELPRKYPRTIGCLICLSTLEHVDEPWFAPGQMFAACRPGALLIVSVPWMFPYHPSPQDHWRFSPTGLRKLFESSQREWEVLEADWRLKIPADAGVLDIHTGRPQAIESCYLVARRRA